MAQRKETKEKVKVRDLKPKKDAKGGVSITRPGRGDAPVGNRAPAAIIVNRQWLRKRRRTTVRSRVRLLSIIRLFDQKNDRPPHPTGVRGGCSPQNNRLVNEFRADGNKFHSASFGRCSGILYLRSGAPSVAPTLRLFEQTDRFWGDSALAGSFQFSTDSIVVCVARRSRCFTKWQRCRVTNLRRGGQLRQSFGELEMLLRGSVCVTEFIPMRFRICRS